jgi:hypothetical protein
VLDVSEPRGGFILRQGDLPVVLLSAGVFHWHNLPQEAPQAFAQAMVDVDGY